MGPTVIKPGGVSGFIFPYAMHPGMGGKHHFEVLIDTNDPSRPTLTFHVYANSLEQSPGH